MPNGKAPLSKSGAPKGAWRFESSTHRHIIMKIFSEIITVAWIAFWLYWLISAIGAKKTARMNRGNAWIRFAILFVVIFLIVQIPALRVSAATANPLLGVIGVAIALAGFALAIWARVHIAKNWGMPMTLKENPELVASGPYRHLRHPIYAGTLLAMLGSVLADGAFWLVFLVAFGTYFIYAAKIEERIMSQQFPAEYPEYKRRTYALIPFIW